VRSAHPQKCPKHNGYGYIDQFSLEMPLNKVDAKSFYILCKLTQRANATQDKAAQTNTMQ